VDNAEINKSPISYDFTITADNFVSIPIGSTIQITFPPDYTGILPASVTCDNSDTPATTLSCSINTSTRTVTITDAFQSSTYQKIFEFTIHGIRNPAVTGLTGAFSVQIGSGLVTVSGGAVTIVEGQGNPIPYLLNSFSQLFHCNKLLSYRQPFKSHFYLRSY